MPFVSIPGFPGKLYVPEAPEKTSQKHPCTDCFSCARCADERCRVCRGKTHCPTGRQEEKFLPEACCKK